VGVSGPVDSMSLPDVEVPGDFSSAAPLLAAACMVPGSEVRLESVNLNPARTGLLGVVERMGADITIENPREVAGEPCGDLLVRGAELTGTEMGPDEVPSMVDEVMLVALLGAVAHGETTIRGAQELRVKESDRIAATASGLGSLGARITEREDGFHVAGAPKIIGGSMPSHGDHRLAMLGAIAGLVSDSGVTVEGFESVSVSYPDFARDLARLTGIAA